jgi:hypothetical protein
MAVKLLLGVPPFSHDFLGDAALFLLTLCVALVLLWKAPIYGSTYGLGVEGVILQRFPRGESLIPYSSLEKVEVYLRRGSLKEIPDRAVRYAKSSVTLLREAGYRLKDYTNSDEVVVLLLTRGKEVYLISPRDPNDLINQLRKRVGRLPVRWIELTRRGKRERAL